MSLTKTTCQHQYLLVFNLLNVLVEITTVFLHSTKMASLQLVRVGSTQATIFKAIKLDIKSVPALLLNSLLIKVFKSWRSLYGSNSS